MMLKKLVIALLCSVAATPAFAQEQAPAAPQDEGVADIVVTATRRAENLQDISASVTAFDAEALQRSSLASTIDLQTRTPGLVFSTNGSFGQPYVRGIGSDIISPGADAPVATYLDGAYQTRPTASVVDFFDMERVEVLKGPQGALYGRNATGGAISLISRRPGDRLGAEGNILYGNYDRLQARGALNLPVGDIVSVRLAGIYTRRDGYTRDTFRGRRIDGEDAFGVRGSILIQPTDRLRLLFIAEHVDEDSTRNNANKLVVAPGLPAPVIDFAPIFGYPAPVISDDPRVIRNDFAPRIQLQQTRLNFQFEWDLGFADLRAVTGWTRVENVGDFDLDGSEISYAFDRETDYSRAFTQSVQLSSPVSGRLSWLVGADFLDERATQNFDARLFGFLFPPGTPQLGQASPLTGIVWDSALDTTAWSVFGELKYDLTETLRLVASGRYSRERKRAVFERTYIDPAGILLAGAAQAPAGTVIPGLGTVTDPVAGTIFFDLLPRATFSRFTPRVALELRPREDLLLYAAVTNGFKSGGFNLQNNGETFSPESVWSYELGMRADWAGGRLRTNVTGFYYDYEDLQVIRFDGLANNVSNADARIYGLELEMVARPSRDIILDGSIAWLDAKYTRYLTLNSNFPGLGEVDLRGNRLPKSPELTVTAGAEYSRQLGNAGELTLRGELRYVSDIFFDQFETPALNQDSYVLLNARVSFRSTDGRWSAALFGRNLANTTYYQSMVRVDQFFGTVATFGAPRTYGVELGVRF